MHPELTDRLASLASKTEASSSVSDFPAQGSAFSSEFCAMGHGVGVSNPGPHICARTHIYTYATELSPQIQVILTLTFFYLAQYIQTVIIPASKQC